MNLKGIGPSRWAAGLAIILVVVLLAGACGTRLASESQGQVSMVSAAPVTPDAAATISANLRAALPATAAATATTPTGAVAFALPTATPTPRPDGNACPHPYPRACADAGWCRTHGQSADLDVPLHQRAARRCRCLPGRSVRPT